MLLEQSETEIQLKIGLDKGLVLGLISRQASQNFDTHAAFCLKIDIFFIIRIFVELSIPAVGRPSLGKKLTGPRGTRHR